MAKGIRLNALAKEINVDSKAILAKLRAEGLEAAAPNHMSTISIGLAETIREWFRTGEHNASGTAVETAAPVDLATVVKPKTNRKRPTRKAGAAADDSQDGGTAVAVEDAPPERPTVTPSRVRDSIHATVDDASVVEYSPVSETSTPTIDEVSATVAPPPVAPVEPAVVDAPAAVDEVAPPKPAAAPVKPVTPPVAPAAKETPHAPPTAPTSAPAAPPAAPPGPGHAAPAAGAHPQRGFGPTPSPIRPTVTLANRAGAQHTPERKPITPAPQLSTLKPAQIQGPRVIRIEKPDVVSAPRARRPVGGPNDGPTTGVTQARPQGGRGVKAKTDEEEELERKAAAKKSASLSARRRGVDGRRGEALEKLKEFTDADRYEREERLRAATASRANLDSHLEKTQKRGTHAFAKSTVEKGGAITIEEPITVKTLSAVMGVKANDIITKLMRQGVFASINQSLDVALAQKLAGEYGLQLEIARQLSLEEQLLVEFEARPRDEANLKPRPPVVTILGHVDHGKTSLLDKIRSANVAAGEAGGITQHTAAWMVTLGEGEKKRAVTFIDTPGHQAFTAMRARGANMTDVVVLVVGAVEGVMPQTIESINHARAAGVPIVVALSKSDRSEANPEMVMGQLAQQDLSPIQWGGQTEVIPTSALTGKGIPELLEILELQSEILELKYDPTAPATGSVIEARIDPGLGPVATVLVQDGTLRVGDVVLAGSGYGRVRSILNDLRQPVQEATAGMPVLLSGLDAVPSAGDRFFVVNDMDRARAISGERDIRNRQDQLALQNRATAGNLLEQIAAADVKTINLIIKADVQGSVETLVATVGGQNTEEVKVKVIHSGVGAISESDVQLAMATKAKPTDNRVSIIGFHVVPDESARQLAEQNHVEIKLYRVIYEIFDDLKKALSGMLTKEVREKLHGHADIRQVFKSSKLGSIAGCMVTDGHVQRGSKVRLIRDGRVITEDLTIDSLKRVKEDAREVKQGFECGIKLAGYDDIKQGDRLEFYIREEFERTL